MRLFSKTLASAILSLYLVLLSAPGHAQVDAYRLYLAERGDIPWDSLSPEEQEALKRHRKNWGEYSSERQEHMRKGAQRYLELFATIRRAAR